MEAVATLPTYIPLTEAAARYGLSEAALRRAVSDGIIRAVRLLGEGIAVADEDVAVIAAQKEAKEEGDELVSLNEAARRLGVDSQTIWRWHKYGWLQKRGTGPRKAVLISLRQARQLYILYKKRGGVRGRRLIPKEMEVDEALAKFG